MKPGMKMMMMERMRQQPENNRSEYSGDNRRLIGFDRGRNGQANTSGYGNMEGGSMNYGNGYGGGGSSGYGENRMEYGMEEMENRRRRDSRGRYMEGEGYRVNRGYGRNETESRRRRDSRGRYMMGGENDEDEEEDMRGQKWYPPSGYMPPQGRMIPSGNSYGDIYAHGTMYAPGAMNKPTGQGSDEQQYSEMDEQTARHWVHKMRNADGTPSPHWQPEQVDPLRMQYCPNCSKWEFWATMNMLYADYGAVAKKMGVDKPEYYACMAKAFLEDEDAKDNKLMRYMKAVAE